MLPILAALAFQAAAQPRLVVPTGHTNGCVDEEPSPDGRTLLTVGADGSIRLWAAESGRELLSTVDSPIGFSRAVFSPDGKLIAAAAGERVALLNAETFGVVRWFSCPKGRNAREVAFSIDGMRLAGLDSEAWQIWKIATGQMIAADRSKPGESTVCFSPDLSRLLCAQTNSSYSVRDVRAGRALGRVDGKDDLEEWSGAFSPRGDLTLTHDGGALVLSDAWSLKAIRRIQVGPGLLYAGFSPDGTRIVVALMSGHCDVYSALGVRLLRVKTKGFVRKGTMSPDGAKLYTIAQNSPSQAWDVRTGIAVSELARTGSQVFDAEFSRDGRSVVTAGFRSLNEWSLAQGQATTLSYGPQDIFTKAWYDSAGRLYSVGNRYLPSELEYRRSLGTEMALWDPKRRSRKSIAKLNRSIIVGSQVFSERVIACDGSAIAELRGARAVVTRAATRTTLPARLPKQASLLAVSSGGRWLLLKSEAGASGEVSVSVIDAVTGRVTILDRRFESEVTGEFSPDGSKIALSDTRPLVELVKTATGKRLRLFATEPSTSVGRFAPDGGRLLCKHPRGTATIVDLKNGTSVRLRGHAGGAVGSASFDPSGKRVATAATDGTVRLWNAATGDELISLIPFRDGGWTVVTPSGLFDASPDALRKMYWVLPDTLETIDLDQVKSRNWVPGLLAKVWKGERLPEAMPFPMDRLPPKVTVEPPAPGSTVATVRVVARSGGVGNLPGEGHALRLTVNGVPVPVGPVVNGVVKAELKGFLLPGAENRLEATAASADGALTARSPAVVATTQETEPVERRLFVMAVGAGRYSGDLSPLVFAPSDARAFGEALQRAGRRMYDDRVSVTILDKEATKETVAEGFRHIERESRPEDTVVVFLAGHGVTYRDGTRSVYAFLTDGATTGDLSDPDVRRRQAVTMDEIVGWMVPGDDGRSGVKAQRRVLILDTCASGAALRSLSAVRSEDPDRVKALDSLRDRTGFWTLAGSSANAVSYESSQFGHGLLTYSLLAGMRGPGLLGDQVDVERLFRYASDETERLLTDLNGVQRPQTFAFERSFPVGLMLPEDRAAIALPSPMARLLRPRELIETTQSFDVLGLTRMLRAELARNRTLALRGAGRAWYVEADEMPGALVPVGTYTVIGRALTVRLRLLRDGKPVATIAESGRSDELPGLVRRLAESVNAKAAKL